MTTYEAKDGTIFRYNKDMSGEIDISAPSAKIGERLNLPIPASDLTEFVAAIVKDLLIESIEGMDREQLIAVYAIQSLTAMGKEGKNDDMENI